MFILLFYLTLFCVVRVKCHQNCKTDLAIKQGFQDYSNSIPIDTSTFTELVQNSKIFVDNTALIGEILQRHSQLPFLIICPGQWGRTTNLDMIKTFLEKKVDTHGNEILPRESTSNYKLFANGEITLDNGTVQKLSKPLRISKNTRIMSKFQGRHPVIFVSFQDVTGTDYDEIEDKIRVAISRAFKQHEYMLEVLQREVDKVNDTLGSLSAYQLEEFQAYLDCKSSTDLIYGLILLYQVLHNHFKADVYVLMDDYDQPVQNFLKLDEVYAEEIKKTIDLVDELTFNIFQQNPYKETGIIFGTFPVMHYLWDNYKTFYIVSENETMRQYFGFNRDHVEVLFNLLNISDDLALQAHKWYNGYESVSLQQRIYNPSSIVRFLHEREISAYWDETYNKDFVQNVLRKQPRFREQILRLLSHRMIDIRQEVQLNASTLLELRQLTKDKNVEPEIGGICEYLLEHGYLTMMSFSKMAKIPNYEIAFIMANHMISYFKQHYSIAEKQLQHAAIVLLNFTRGDLPVATLRQALTDIYDNSARFVNDKKTMSYEVLNCIVLRIQCLSKFRLDVYYVGTRKADIIMLDPEREHAAVIEVTYDQLAMDAYEKAYSGSHVLQRFENNARTVKLIGIDVSPKEVVTIIAKSL